jgi:hypothetical protein
LIGKKGKPVCCREMARVGFGVAGRSRLQYLPVEEKDAALGIG